MNETAFSNIYFRSWSVSIQRYLDICWCVVFDLTRLSTSDCGYLFFFLVTSFRLFLFEWILFACLVSFWFPWVLRWNGWKFFIFQQFRCLIAYFSRSLEWLSGLQRNFLSFSRVGLTVYNLQLWFFGCVNLTSFVRIGPELGTVALHPLSSGRCLLIIIGKVVELSEST